MADVQIDNGEFTRIANILLEQTARLRLNGTQYSIILTVWRFTYGFQRCEHNLSVTFIAKATGVSTRGVKRELKILVDRNILLVTKESTKADSRKLKFNKDYDSWEWRENALPKEQGNNSSPGEQLFPSQGNDTSPQQGNNSSPKKETKEKSKDIYTIFDYWNNAKVIVHRSMTNKVKGHINSKLAFYSVEEICKTISNYSTVVKEEQYFFTYKWGLGDFLTRGFDQFKDESEPLKNFLDKAKAKTEIQPKSTEDKSREIIARQMEAIRKKKESEKRDS